MIFSATRFRAALAASAAGIALVSLLATAAQAQETLPPPRGGTSVPPRDPAVDGQSVDAVSGIFTVASPAISIGAPGAGGLSWAAIHADGDWRHSVMGGIVRLDANTYRVVIAEGVEDFDLNAGVFTAVRENGSSLSASGTLYTYTSRNGAVATFDTSLIGDEQLYGFDVAYITSLETPSGYREEYNYQVMSFWDSYTPPNSECGLPDSPFETCPPEDYLLGPVWRLQSLTNNYGYMLRFEYASATASSISQYEDWMELERVEAVNLAVDYCDPFNNSCSTSQDWPEILIDQPSGTLRTYTDSLSRETRLTLDGNDRVTGVRYPGETSNSVTVVYSTGGQVNSVTRSGLTTSYARSEASGVRTTTVTYPGSVVVDIESSLSTGLVDAVENSLGERTEYAYDADSRLESVTYPEGNSTHYAYDSRGNVTSVIVRDKNDANPLTTMTASYPASCSNPVICNQPEWVEDAAGNRTEFDYNTTHGGAKWVQAPEVDGIQPETRFTYTLFYASYKDATGNVVQAADGVYMLRHVRSCRTGEAPSCEGTEDELWTRLNYDHIGSHDNLNLTYYSERAGDNTMAAVTATEFDEIGNPIMIDLTGHALDNRTEYTYDALRRRTSAIGPDPDDTGPLTHSAQRITYDTRGRVTQTEFGTMPSYTSSWTSFTQLDRQAIEYTSANQVAATRLISGSTTHALIQYSYDSAGRLDCVAQRMNTATFASPPSSACTLATAGSQGPDRIARTSYDSLGRRSQVETAHGTSVAAVEAAWTYTDNGRVETLTDGEGNRTTYVYDDFDRLTDTRYPSTTQGSGTSNPNDYTRLTYDTYGRIATRRTRSGQTFSYTYDARNRVSSVDAPSGTDDTDFTYDNHGRILTVSDGTDTLTNTYNARGWLASQTLDGRTVTYTYNTLGERTRMDWPDGFYVTYRYTQAGQLLTIYENGDGTGLERLAEFTYDQHGRRILLERGNAVDTSYSYDAASRLEELAQDLTGTASDRTLDFTYNPAGQITSRTDSNPGTYAWTDFVNFTQTATHNGLNQILSVTNEVTAPQYDTNGNMTRDHLGQTYGYDQYNRLTNVGGASNIGLSYDPVGRLHETTGTGITLREFVYDGLDLIAEYNGSTLQARYVHGPGMDEPLVQYTGVGTRSWLIADERGSIVAHVDNNGDAIQINAYDEYGVPDSANAGRFGYTGQVWLEETGLYHYKNRAYNPLLGRFMQADPIGVAGGMNLYAYVGGDPVNLVDPLGLDDEDLIIVTALRPSCPFNSICDRDAVAAFISGFISDNPWGASGGGEGGDELGGQSGSGSSEGEEACATQGIDNPPFEPPSDGRNNFSTLRGALFSAARSVGVSRAQQRPGGRISVNGGQGDSPFFDSGWSQLSFFTRVGRRWLGGGYPYSVSAAGPYGAGRYTGDSSSALALMVSSNTRIGSAEAAAEIARLYGVDSVYTGDVGWYRLVWDKNSGVFCD